MRVDERHIRKEKYTDSKVSGYMWTGPLKWSPIMREDLWWNNLALNFIECLFPTLFNVIFPSASWLLVRQFDFAGDNSRQITNNFTPLLTTATWLPVWQFDFVGEISRQILQIDVNHKQFHTSVIDCYESTSGEMIPLCRGWFMMNQSEMQTISHLCYWLPYVNFQWDGLTLQEMIREN